MVDGRTKAHGVLQVHSQLYHRKHARSVFNHMFVAKLSAPQKSSLARIFSCFMLSPRKFSFLVPVVVEPREWKLSFPRIAVDSFCTLSEVANLKMSKISSNFGPIIAFGFLLFGIIGELVWLWTQSDIGRRCNLQIHVVYRFFVTFENLNRLKRFFISSFSSFQPLTVVLFADKLVL